MAKFGLKEKAEAVGAEVVLLEGPGQVDVADLARRQSRLLRYRRLIRRRRAYPRHGTRPSPWVIGDLLAHIERLADGRAGETMDDRPDEPLARCQPESWPATLEPPTTP